MDLLIDCLLYRLIDWLQVVLERVVQKFQEKDDYLMRLEKQINPLLDDDDLTALTYIFSEIMEKNIKTLQVRTILKGGFAKSERGMGWLNSISIATNFTLISSDRYRIQSVISLYPLSFFANTPFKGYTFSFNGTVSEIFKWLFMQCLINKVTLKWKP